MPATIRVQRIYDPISDGDGRRILVDRLWPRGVSKEAARVELWLREIAPSRELREQFCHDPDRWHDFRAGYFEELDSNRTLLEPLLEVLEEERDGGMVTLLFAAKETRFNNAVALAEYLQERC